MFLNLKYNLSQSKSTPSNCSWWVPTKSPIPLMAAFLFSYVSLSLPAQPLLWPGGKELAVYVVDLSSIPWSIQGRHFWIGIHSLLFLRFVFFILWSRQLRFVTTQIIDTEIDFRLSVITIWPRWLLNYKSSMCLLCLSIVEILQRLSCNAVVWSRLYFRMENRRL